MTDSTAAAGDSPPLEGVRILDLTRATSGPYCTQILADLGADVVKLEEPPGPRGRDQIDPFKTIDGMDAYFLCVNRSKRSISFPLGHERGPELVAALAAAADVVIENFRPGVAEKLGVGSAQLRAANSRLITCSLSGFGANGPLKDRAAFDITVQAQTGVMSFIDRRDPVGRLAPIPMPVADLLAGIYCAVAIPAALVRRAATGEGAHIDVAMYDALLSWFVGFGVHQLNFGQPTDIQDKILWGSFETKDRPLVITAHRPSQWQRFCAALDRHAWLEDPRFADPTDRASNIDELKTLIADVLATRRADEWIAAFEREGLSFSDTFTMAEALEHPHTVEREMVVEVDDPAAGPIRLLGNPVKFAGVEPNYSPPPRVGQHSVEVLSEWLGYNRDQLENLVSSDFVYDPGSS
jgi:crotonobetainyl-CoA:carnitine CoA-transferase CaiB-like acyl-CoA transferase